ncbi:(2Fe-2S)-binding protein [Litoribacillus peritrichatus]|uniref:(2Fe-2S)-binding protein n=1 Tax=Litoribacillus peritrichatus TaxID=718191 RepID=A0ABP7N5R0_9GAMM
MKLSLNINGNQQEVDVDPNTPLLWVIRDHLQLTGTKFGCGMALCGACTVHMNGNPIRSCVTPVSSVQGQSITTIEGVTESDLSKEANAVVDAWEDIAVVQCGYCQSGQIMSATALLKQNPNPSDQDINNFMSGNICRCATYKRIKDGIKQAAQTMQIAQSESDLFYNASEENVAHATTDSEGVNHNAA